MTNTNVGCGGEEEKAEEEGEEKEEGRRRRRRREKQRSVLHIIAVLMYCTLTIFFEFITA